MRQIDGRTARLPLVYSIDEIARRYGVFPASLDLHDPDTLRWFRRALIFMSMEADRDVGLRKRYAR